MEIQTEWIDVAVSDGTTMRVYVATPEPQPRAVIIVFQEIFGVNSHIRSVADRFAKEGYLAISPELFHRTGPKWEAGYTEPEIQTGIGHMMKMTPEGLAADIKAAFAFAKENNLPITATGFCMGGRTAFLTASLEPLACAISFYGGGIAPGPFGPGLLGTIPNLQAPVLFLWGGKDTHIPAAAEDQIIQAMRASGKSFVTTEFSEAEHGFFCDQRGSYNPAAAAVAWPLALAYLAQNTTKAAGA